MPGLTVLGSGSKGNALVIHGKDGKILIDAGFSLRQLRNRLEASDVSEDGFEALLVSHEHSDHAQGVRLAANHLQTPIYCNRGTGTYLKNKEKKLPQLNLFASGYAFRAGEFSITPFTTPHDAREPVGFVVESGDFRAGIVTDLGHVTSTVSHYLRECDILVLESNHDLELLRQAERPWTLKQRIISRHGHLSNPACAELIANVIHEKTRHVCLFHASEECNRYEIVEESLKTALEKLARPDIVGSVARQEVPLQTFML